MAARHDGRRIRPDTVGGGEEAFVDAAVRSSAAGGAWTRLPS